MSVTMLEQQIAITGVGDYSPGNPVTNDELASILPFPVKMMMSYFGVESRYYVVDPRTGQPREEGLGVAEMSARAARQAMKQAGIESTDIDMLVTATSTPDAPLPPLSHSVQRLLGLPRVQMLDIRGGCVTSVQGLMVAEAMILAARANTVLVTAADCISPHFYTPLLHHNDPSSEAIMNGLLFADGAGAVVLRRSDLAPSGCMHLKFAQVVSRFSDKAPGFGLGHGGVTQHKHRQLRDTLPIVANAANEDLLRASGGIHDDIDVLIVPQANRSMLNLVQTNEMRWKQFYLGHLTGNSPAPAILRALCKAIECGRIQPGKTRVGIIAIESASWLYGVARLN